MSDYIHLGGGVIIASTVSSDFSFGVGAAYGAVTLGNYENNITVNVGWGAVKTEEGDYQTTNPTYSWRLAKKPMLTFSGMARLARKFAVVTENWVFSTKEYSSYANIPATYKYRTVMSGGFRFLGERNSFDFGLAIPVIEDSAVGIPYLDYVFKF